MKKKSREIDETPDFEERGRPTKPLQCEVLHEDSELYIINKPAGMFFEGGLFDDPSVVEQLCGDGDPEEAGLEAVYPLEPDVSGLMAIARNQPTLEALQNQFDDGRLTVTFLALVRGILMHESGSLEDLITSPQSGKVKVIAEHGEPARTEWRVRDSFIGFALLECAPRTRLPSQIRAQLLHAGLPLAVDAVHGGAEFLKLSSFKPNYRPSRRHPERPLIKRPSLHAWKIELTHPKSGVALTHEAPAPKDFKAAMNQLDRFGRIRK